MHGNTNDMLRNYDYLLKYAHFMTDQRVSIVETT